MFSYGEAPCTSNHSPFVAGLAGGLSGPAEYTSKNNANLPMRPGLWMWPGMIPILQPSGLMIPGQLGPTRRLLFWERRACATYGVRVDVPHHKEEYIINLQFERTRVILRRAIATDTAFISEAFSPPVRPFMRQLGKGKAFSDLSSAAYSRRIWQCGPEAVFRRMALSTAFLRRDRTVLWAQAS